MSETVLVTGADGFVGRHLTRALASHGYDVKRHTRRDGDIAHGPLQYKDVRHVFHLAARTSVPESWSNPPAYYETNVLGAVNVLEFCRTQGAGLTLVSSYVYGVPDRLPIAEDHPLRAFNPYGHSKILAEEAARYYAGQFGVKVAIVRPFNLYGSGQSDRFLIPSLIRQAVSPVSDHITIEDPRPRRDYLLVDDFIDLLLAVFEQGSFETYNAGAGKSVSIEELVSLINSFTIVKKRVCAKGVVRPDDVLDVVADIEKARRQLHWEPRTPLEEGLKRLVGTATSEPERRELS